jgi:hypothetical protein
MAAKDASKGAALSADRFSRSDLNMARIVVVTSYDDEYD